jgi:hypothetical protein
MPVIEYVKARYRLNYVDMVAEAGPIGILSGSSECVIAKSIRKRVETSITKRNNKIIAVVAHYGCAGNPIERDAQLEQMRTAVRVVESWDYKARVIGLWVDEIWAAHEIG